MVKKIGLLNEFWLKLCTIKEPETSLKYLKDFSDSISSYLSFSILLKKPGNRAKLHLNELKPKSTDIPKMFGVIFKLLGFFNCVKNN